MKSNTGSHHLLVPPQILELVEVLLLGQGLEWELSGERCPLRDINQDMINMFMSLKIGQLVQTDPVPLCGLEGGHSVAHLEVLIQGVTILDVIKPNLA